MPGMLLGMLLGVLGMLGLLLGLLGLRLGMLLGMLLGLLGLLLGLLGILGLLLGKNKKSYFWRLWELAWELTMSKGINKVILVGNCGQDPEVRYMPSGGAVANITIATSESWQDKKTGNQEKRTEWHRIVFFGKLAEIVQQYVKKGSKLYVEGSLRTRKWQGQDGQDRYTTEIVGSEMQMLDSKNGRSEASSPPRAAGGQQTSQATPNFVDDDIPF